MSFEVRLVRGGKPFFTFGSHTPFLEPEHKYDHAPIEPPALVSVTKTWTVDGRIYGSNEAAVMGQWTSLTGALEDPAKYPDGVELVRDGVTVEAISPAQGYRTFRIEHLSAPRVERAFRTELHFVTRISGVRVFPLLGATNPQISKLSLNESWAYSEAGLLTKTLTGDLEVITGASATAVARTLGLTLPGSNFGFLTAGPEGVDVDELDQSDLKARFRSIVQEAGGPLPGGVGPGYTRSVHVTRTSGETLTTTTVNATGPGAEAAVRREKPSAALSETVTVDSFRRTATAVYVQEKIDDGRLLRTHRFSTRGGGRPIRYTRRTGGRLPAKHVLPRAEVEVQEEIQVEITGTPWLADFQLPAPPKGLDEDTSELSFSPLPTRVVIGATRAADKWVMGVKRVYRAEELGDVLDEVGRAIVAPGSGSNPQREVARSDGS